MVSYQLKLFNFISFLCLFSICSFEPDKPISSYQNSVHAGHSTQFIWNIFNPNPQKNQSVFDINNNNKPDYYWRDFHGSIPKDAIPGGFNLKQGKRQKIYMGQVNTLKDLPQIQPVAINSQTSNVTYSFEGVFSTKDHIKILCSSDSRIVTWMPRDTFDFLKSKDALVVAGVERSTYTLYFGKTSHQGHTVIGKIHAGDGKPHMSFPFNGKEVSAAEYQILAFADEAEDDEVIEVEAA